MTKRYFIDQNGAKTMRMQGPPGGGHYEIAQEVLGNLGIEPRDYADHYERMFKLKFVRVVEHHDGTVEVEYRGRLTGPQRRVLDELERASKGGLQVVGVERAAKRPGHKR